MGRLTYRLGFALGRLPLWGKLVVLAIAIYCVSRLFSANDSTDSQSGAQTLAKLPQPEAVVAAKESTALDAVNEDCSALRFEKYKEFMASSNYWHAANVIRKCAEHLPQGKPGELLKAAEVKSYLVDISNQKLSPAERVRFMDMFIRDYPDVADKHNVPKRMAQEEKKIRAQIAKHKASQGVSIGMTQEDVLASSWGRPDRVHRTTTSRGEREQWVYGGGNYLYFQDGVLVTIQN